MSVIEALRDLSEMEYYKVALTVRRDVTQWLLRDFGATKKTKPLRMVIKDPTPEETAAVNAIFEAHGQSLNKQFLKDYPQWFVDFERNRLITYACDVVTNIVKANSIYPQSMAELDQRRCLQDLAIANCYAIYGEIEFIQSFFIQDLNFLSDTLAHIKREIHLLKGWRQSDNKFKAKFKEKEK